VQPPLGQVQAVELDVGPGLADAVQSGHQRVHVVDHLVAVGQHRAGHAEVVAVGLEQPDQEVAPVGLDPGEVVAVQPAVEVGVPQIGPLAVQAAQVGQGDAELGADPLISNLGRPVDATKSAQGAAAPREEICARPAASAARGRIGNRRSSTS
jgi:hypothetical protein